MEWLSLYPGAEGIVISHSAEGLRSAHLQASSRHRRLIVETGEDRELLKGENFLRASVIPITAAALALETWELIAMATNLY